MAAPPARARADYDYLIKLLLIGDSGKVLVYDWISLLLWLRVSISLRLLFGFCDASSKWLLICSYYYQCLMWLNWLRIEIIGSVSLRS